MRRLTEGRIYELCRLSFPLMLTSLSYALMLFIDRWLLASYSSEAFTSASLAATTGWVFILSILFLAGISEVFVAQHNGAGHFHKLGQPVWQMIWLSLFSVALYLPLGIFAGPYLLSKESEQIYFRYMMLFGPAVALSGALSGFFIGQGKAVLVSLTTLFANIVNAGLDIVLIFGIPGWIEPLGLKGAAIATSSSALFQCVVLAAFFLSKNNRLSFGTLKWRLSPMLFWNCLKIGIPGALFISVEISGWAIFYHMMSQISDTHLMIAGIFQSFGLLFYFFGEGMGRAAATLAGNMIGAQNKEAILTLLKSGAALHLVFLVLLLGLFVCFGQTCTGHFLPDPDHPSRFSIESSLPPCMALLLAYLFFEGLRLFLAGILTAAGDTVFLLLAGTFSIWIFLILPIYLFVVQREGSIELACTLSVCYAAAATLLYFIRFLQGKWREIQLIETA